MTNSERSEAMLVPPPSGRRPSGNLAEADVRMLATELTAYHACFSDVFQRSEQRDWSALFLRAQLMPLDRKSIEPMVLALNGADPAAVRAVQQFLSEGSWDDRRVLARLEHLVAEDLAEADACVIVDGSGFPKQGKHSVGVARQYCGHLGKIANCQHGVFALYCGSKGYSFVDHRLYMPAQWFDAEHAPLRARCRVPEEVHFTTEPSLALEIVRGIAERATLAFEWVLGDETYGADPKFLDGVEALGKRYFVEVPVSTRVWVGRIEIEPAGTPTKGRPVRHARAVPGTPSPREMRHIARELPASAWRRYTIKAGAKGEIAADFAFVYITRSVRQGRPAAAAWAVFRRDRAEGSSVKYFLTNAPRACAKRQLARLSGARWPIETAFEEAKGELGMDQYEVRTWRGWHHQMTQTFLAYHFLVRMRQRGKKSGADVAATAGVTHRGSLGGHHDHRASNRDRRLPPATQLGRLSISPPTTRRLAEEATMT